MYSAPIRRGWSPRQVTTGLIPRATSPVAPSRPRLPSKPNQQHRQHRQHKQHKLSKQLGLHQPLWDQVWLVQPLLIPLYQRTEAYRRLMCHSHITRLQQSCRRNGA